MPFYPYPSVADATDAAKVIISKLKGADVPLGNLVNAGYVVEGYALSVTIPVDGGLAKMSAQDRTPFSKSELQSQLESFVASGEGMKAVPWLKIWAALKVLIDLWMSQSA